MKCRYCGGELYGGKGDYWHIPEGNIIMGDPSKWPMRCPDGEHLGQPEPKDEAEDLAR